MFMGDAVKEKFCSRIEGLGDQGIEGVVSRCGGLWWGLVVLSEPACRVGSAGGRAAQMVLVKGVLTYAFGATR